MILTEYVLTRHDYLPQYHIERYHYSPRPATLDVMDLQGESIVVVEESTALHEVVKGRSALLSM